MKKVEGHANLYKDLESGVINNRGTTDRDRYRIAKQNALRQIDHDAEIKRLGDEISQIKDLLQQLTKAIT